LLAGLLLFRPRFRPAGAALACIGLAGAFVVAALWVAAHPR
jgi:hypothetical protein